MSETATGEIHTLVQEVQQLRKRIDRQEDRIQRLESTLDDERARCRRAERRLAAIDREFQARPDVEIRGKDFIENVWIGGLPIGNGITLRADEIQALEETVAAIDDRLHDLEVGEVDPGEVIAESGGPNVEDLLPIHQKYLAVTNLPRDQHGLYERQELAARVFPYFHEYAFTIEGRMVLPSTKVRDIIDREIRTPDLETYLDVADPNPNTIREVMKWLGKFGGDILEFNTDEKQNRLLANRDAWVEYTKTVMADEIETHTTTETDPDETAATDFERVDEATPVTDASADTIDAGVETRHE